MHRQRFKRSTKRQRGYILAELALALIVSSIILMTQFSELSYNVSKNLAKGTAQYMVQLQSGLNRYYLENSSKLLSNTAFTVGSVNFNMPLEPTKTQLISAGYLPAGLGKSPLGLDFTFKFIRNCATTPCRVEGLIYSTTAYRDDSNNIRTDILGIVVSEIGADGAQSLVGSGGELTGFGKSFTLAASAFSTTEGMVAIRIGDGTGISGLLSQYYRLDGSTPLTGTMNANGQDIQNVASLTASNVVATTSATLAGLTGTGTSRFDTVVINNSAKISAISSLGDSCTAAEETTIHTNSNGVGLLMCKSGTWQIIGHTIPGITEGGACSSDNLFGTDSVGRGYVCNGVIWRPAVQSALAGSACATPGQTATSSTTGETLVCKNSVFVKLANMLTKNVQVGPHLLVTDGAVIAKPTCDIGGVASYSLGIAQAGVDVSNSQPYQSSYAAAVDNGSSWTVLVKLKRSAADGGGETSATPYGLGAIITAECMY